MQTTSPQKNGSPFQQGLIFGIGLGVFNVILSAISTFAKLGGAGIIVTIISIIAGILAYGFAGSRTAQATGKVGKGALAGLFAGLFAGIIGAIGTIVFTFMNIDTLRQRSQDTANQLHLASTIQYTNALIISGAIVGVVLSVLLALGLGAGIGAIGGLIGRGRAKVEVPVYQDNYSGPPSTSDR
jgi:hypothetical protein